MAEQQETAAQRKAAKLLKMKAKLQNEEIKEFKVEEVVPVVADVLLPPFDDNGDKQGKWLQGGYKFGEWYYDMLGNPVFFSPSCEGDDVGDLYNADSSPYMDFNQDQLNNTLPIILITTDNEYFSFIPNFELKLPTNIQIQTNKADDGNNVKKIEKEKKVVPIKEPVPPKIPKRLQKLETASATVAVADYKHEKLVSLQDAIDYEAKNFKEGQDMIKVDRERESANIVFIGHVDAGKSTLSGRILKNCGEVDETEIRKFEIEAKEKNRESWVLAYIMDINEEERSKGITVECGKAHFQLKNRRFVLLDAPGHKNYVPNMIAGACQADCAALIISARQGEFEAGFEGGQTQEHAHLAKALGVQHMICVVSKMDEVNWDQKRYEYIHDNVEPFLRNQVGITSIEWVPINGFLNENIDTPLTPDRCNWYSGDTLFDKFNKVPVPIRDPNGPLRIPVLDKLKEQGQFLFGKIESGTIRDDLWVTLMPYKKQFQIQSIYNTKDQRILYASAGENVKIKLKGIEEKDIERGYMVCGTEELCPITQLFIAEITILQLPEHKPIMSQGYSCVLHMHTCVSEIEIEEVEAVQNPESKKLTKNTFLKSNQTGVVKIGLKSLLCLEKFDSISQLGRFTLRDEEKTIGFGKVMKIKPFKV